MGSTNIADKSQVTTLDGTELFTLLVAGAVKLMTATKMGKAIAALFGFYPVLGLVANDSTAAAANTLLIQTALNAAAAAGGGDVFVGTPGTITLTKGLDAVAVDNDTALYVWSGTSFRASPKTTFKLAASSNCYILTNRYLSGGGTSGTSSGADHHIVVEGGAWDMNCGQQTPDTHYNGHGMSFETVQDLTIRNTEINDSTTTGDSGKYGINGYLWTRVKLQNITGTHNTIVQAENGLVDVLAENITGTANTKLGDDQVSFGIGGVGSFGGLYNAYYYTGPVSNRQPMTPTDCNNVTVRNVIAHKGSAVGMHIGDTRGTFTNLTIQNITCMVPTSLGPALAINSWNHTTQQWQHVRLENIYSVSPYSAASIQADINDLQIRTITNNATVGSGNNTIVAFVENGAGGSITCSGVSIRDLRFNPTTARQAQNPFVFVQTSAYVKDLLIDGAAIRLPAFNGASGEVLQIAGKVDAYALDHINYGNNGTNSAGTVLVLASTATGDLKGAIGNIALTSTDHVITSSVTATVGCSGTWLLKDTTFMFYTNTAAKTLTLLGAGHVIRTGSSTSVVYLDAGAIAIDWPKLLISGQLGNITPRTYDQLTDSVSGPVRWNGASWAAN